uniref:NosL n=1 Tax=uncultured Nitrospirae bacterium MY2-3C TaxID=798577 RepID=D9MP00_9BACT|nr:unknown protein [uncultured Nitrospirae bacterium MY2-3C]
MKIAKFLVIIVCVVLVPIAALAIEGKCPLCGMNIEGNENTLYEITFKDGKTQTYCCPHCGLWEHSTGKDTVTSARVKNFISGEWVDAQKAYYLYNSTATPACSPSWIAFEKETEAKMFMKGFGGELYTFEKALKVRGDQPKSMKMAK